MLGIQIVHLSLYIWGDLLAFNDSITHPQGVIDLTLATREGERERKLILNFLVISC